MGKAHRTVMSRVIGAVRPIFLDTPAGFELNADQISAKAIEYFKQRLQQDLVVASFKSAAAATPAEIKNVLSKLRTANLIFAGPGSPTYAVRNWRDTVVFETVARRLAENAHLVLASAAAIAVGRYVLPVYEIYKVGDAPHWTAGLDLLGSYGLDLAIVPHWNNAEGGQHDTRYCFMGEPRLVLLEQLLPDSAVILGIDEYTACMLDLGSGDARVMGAGQVTIRCKGREKTFPPGARFQLVELKTGHPLGEQGDLHTAGAVRPSLTQPEAVLVEQATDGAFEAGIHDGNGESVASYIDLIVAVRTQLRVAEQWALADEIRRQLSKLGIILEDRPAGTTWRRE